MLRDALFQLGMGSVRLDATQTEETLSPRPLIGRDIFACVPHLAAGTGAAATAARLGAAAQKQRGNSAKARIHRNVPREPHCC